jgi:hypothetical protein
MVLNEELALLLARADLPIPGAGIIGHTEVVHWPQACLGGLVRAGLLSPALAPSSITCPACFEDHSADVLWTEAHLGEPSRPYLICPGYGRVLLQPAQLERWRIDIGALARALAVLLNDGLRTKMIVPERLWHLGSIEMGSSLHDLFLLRGVAWSDSIVRGLDECLSSYLAPLVLSLTDVPADLKTSVRLLPLPRVLSLSEDHLILDRRYLDALSQPPDEETAPYLFRQTGEMWTVVFEGRRSWFKDRVGLRYLQEMLRHPGQLIPVAMLFAAVHGQSSISRTQDQDEDEEPEQRGVVDLGPQGDLGKLLDEAAVQTYRQRVNELRNAACDARENYDHERADALQEELSLLLDELSAAQGQAGKPRRVSGASGNIRSSVTQALSDARKLITVEDPELGEHLRQHLTTGKDILYAPSRPIPWVF